MLIFTLILFQSLCLCLNGEKMVPSFDIEKLSLLLKDFHKITKIRITVFDTEMNELVAYPRRLPPICQLIRTKKEGFEACMRCDRRACEAAKKQQEMRVYRCHAGLTEVVAPLFSHSIHIGYLLIGNIMEYPDSDAACRAVAKCCKKLSLPDSELDAACRERPLFTRDYVLSASRIFQAVSYYVLYDRLVSLPNEDLAATLDDYIETHISEPLTARSICQSLGIGKSQLYKISESLYGSGIAKHIRFIRIEKAKRLFAESPALTTAKVAALCGFSDYNYFITAFTRETGVTPGEFRKRF